MIHVYYERTTSLVQTNTVFLLSSDKQLSLSHFFVGK